MDVKGWIESLLNARLEGGKYASVEDRHSLLKRNLIALMLVVTLTPLFSMAVINYYQYQEALRKEVVSPMKVLVNKTRHSFALVLAARLSTVRFIAAEYSFEDLNDARRFNRVFRSLKSEFKGFVDLGLIDGRGTQVQYVGPYNLKGQDYSNQEWYRQVRVEGEYVSDVFLGFRKFPHFVIAVQRVNEKGEHWVLRATMGTEIFDELIAAMGLGPESDAFLINHQGVLQTRSKFYGAVFEKFPFSVPPYSVEASVVERVDPLGRRVLMVYSYILDPDFILVLVKPESLVFKSWYTLKGGLFYVLVISTFVILVVIFRVTNRMVERMKQSDEERELAMREMEHAHKLSSIGRLAAGVAHEINNPLAIIGEKAGLFRDLIELNPNFPDRERFIGLVDAISRSVDRCSTITHRLLGFARRMEVQIERLDVAEVLRESVSFMEKEALYKNIHMEFDFDNNLEPIWSDRGRLQQVFLNILNNALAAVEEGGSIFLATFHHDENTVGVIIRDDGTGMSQETLKRIFDPFFTTKGGSGTGLGLSITYGIVKKLGGEIEVQSAPGRGTRFTIYLPKKAPELHGEEHGTP